MKTIFLQILFLMLSASFGWAQQQDSALNEVKVLAMLEDTSKVNYLNDLALSIQNKNPTQAIAYLELAVTLAKKLEYDYGGSVALTNRATLLFYEAKLDTAKLLLDEAYKLVELKDNLRSQKQLALISQRYASLYQQKQRYDSAVLMYQQAAARFQELNDPTKVIVCYYNLSGIYNTLADNSNALRYARETQKIARKSGDSTYILRSYMALADAYSGAQQYDSVYAISRQGLSMANQFNQPFPIGKFHYLLGSYFNHKNQYDSAINHFTLALKSYESINLGFETSLTLYQIGHSYLQKNNFNSAVEYLQQALARSTSLKLDQVMKLTLADLAKAEEYRGNYKESTRYLKEFIVVSDSITQRNNRNVVYDLETKYQVSQKEARLLLQENVIKQKSLLNYLLIVAVISVIVIIFFLFYTFMQKRKLSEQRIRELEQEKLLLSSEAIIKGQEEERGRLAKDLHDGLGGMLSGIKFSLSHMKSNVVLDTDGILMFERALDMLDHSIAELRRVAHNMMPEVLVKFGLVEAVKSYCESLNQSGIFKINFQTIGSINRLESNREIIIYRIIQELVNNSAKHAKATQVIVQLVGDTNSLSVTVEDNGSGFDLKRLDQNQGSGWTSIRSRVEYIKGKIDVQTDTAKGTSVQLIVPL